MLVLHSADFVITLTAAEAKALVTILDAGSVALSHQITLHDVPVHQAAMKELRIALGIGNNLQMKLERQNRRVGKPRPC